MLGHRKKDEEEVDPEQARKDLERLEMTRKKRWGPSLAGCAIHVVMNVWMAGHAYSCALHVRCGMDGMVLCGLTLHQSCCDHHLRSCSSW